MADERFWLYEWLDNLDIRSYGQAQKLLEDRVALTDLRERAGSVPYTTERLPPGDAPTLVAGRAIDLSGHLDCLGWECVQKQVDVLFNHVWHYFDRIVVVGPSAHEISSSFDNGAGLPRHLPTYIRLLLYLREIGAEELLLFRQKRPPCQVHLRQHLKEVGIEDVESQAESLIPRLAQEATIQVKPRDGHIDYTFRHAEFEHTEWGSIRADFNDDLPRAVARAVVRKYLAAFASDVYTARTLSCALGSTIRFHRQLLNDEIAGSRNDKVAFQLELPVVDGLDARTLLKIRNDEKLSFNRFHRALLAAINERLAANANNNARKIANEIYKDILEPALADIELRLKAATRSLRKKAGISLAIGVPTIYGLYTVNPLLIAAGVAPLVTSVHNAVHRCIEERGNVALSDMFFLWQAQKHALKHAA